MRQTDFADRSRDEQIGAIAGTIWQFLNSNDQVSASKLVKEIEGSRDLIMQGIGWLAREGKLEFIAKQKGKQRQLIRLK
ncbi:hypothetical protein MNBD_PLANCTO02-1134 [hydrothermal vent metagenome]|uniref:Winged helix-turn-helix domain-containing protein n=1 Tax=hydrothermal vent metagenome TaxID=652676 RepID=A0A3B1DGX3_9ZZZZ